MIMDKEQLKQAMENPKFWSYLAEAICDSEEMASRIPGITDLDEESRINVIKDAFSRATPGQLSGLLERINAQNDVP